MRYPYGLVEELRIANANLKRVADAKPEELNQELLDENQALREQVAELVGALDALKKKEERKEDA